MSDFSKLNGYDVKDAQARSDLSNLTSSVNDLGDDVSALTNIVSDTTNPIYYGADPTGVEDSTTAINDCIEANKGGTINFTIGKYKITNQIELPYNMLDKVSINGNGSIINVYSDLDTVFKVGTGNTDNRDNDVGYTSYIKDLTIHCENYDVTYCFDIVKGFKDFHILNINSYRTVNGVRIGESTGMPSDVLITDSLFYGNGSEYAGVGIISNCTDNYVSNTRIYGFRTGIECNGSINCTKVHVLLRWSNQTSSNFDPIERNSQTFNEAYEQTSFAILNDSGKFSECCCDSTYKFFDVINNGNYTILNNSSYINARSNVNCMLFDIHEDVCNLIVSNNLFAISKNTSGIGYNLRKTLSVGTQLKNFNNTIMSVTNLTNPFDIIYHKNFEFRTNKTFPANGWYVVGLLNNVTANSTATLTLYINSWQYKFRIQFNENNICNGIYQIGNSTDSTNYTVGVLSDGTNKYICIKSSSLAQYMKHDIKLETASNLCYLISCPTVPGDHPTSSNSLLSSFTNSTPEHQKALNSALMSN